jgi:hypothetical protein
MSAARKAADAALAAKFLLPQAEGSLPTQAGAGLI